MNATSATPSKFLSGSATANRSALARQRVQGEPVRMSFSRDANATLQSAPVSVPLRGISTAAPSKTGSDTESRRDKALRIVETIQIGPKAIEPDDDDHHFKLYEPTSGIKLRRRITPHVDVNSHLDGRHIVPISTLFSIALHEKSDDGDFSIPIFGDWMTFGTVVDSTDMRKTPGHRLDRNRNRIDEKSFDRLYMAYRKRKEEEQNGAPDDLADVDNPHRNVLKTIPPIYYKIYTLLDFGQPLVKGETAGDSLIEMVVYAGEDRIGLQNGKTTYVGGSEGVLEMLEARGPGLVLGLMNPLVMDGPSAKLTSANVQRKDNEDRFLAGKPAFRAAEKKEDGKGSMHMRLKPRSFDCVMPIGYAGDYQKCRAIRRKDGQECSSYVDLRTPMKACSFHVSASTDTSRRYRQEFANGTSRIAPPSRNEFAFSDGMSLNAQSRTYLTRNTETPTFAETRNPTSRYFNVEGIGRDAEARLLRHEKEQDDLRLGFQLAAQSYRDKRPTASQPRSNAKPAPYTGNGAKAVGDAVKRLNASAAAALRGTKRKATTAKRSRPDQIDALPIPKRAAWAHDKVESERRSTTRSTLPLSMGAGMKAGRPALPQSCSSSSKLLARHTATAASLPKPIMRLTQPKGLSAVRPPPGERFYAVNDSDEELDNLLASADINFLPSSASISIGGSTGNPQCEEDADSDFEIIY